LRFPSGRALACGNLVECAPFRFHPRVRVTGEHGARPHLPNGHDATRAAGGHLAPSYHSAAAIALVAHVCANVGQFQPGRYFVLDKPRLSGLSGAATALKAVAKLSPGTHGIDLSNISGALNAPKA
jgi:hypothetical protein